MLPTTPAAQRPDNNPIGRRGAKLAKRDEDMGRQKVWEPEMVERGVPSSGGSRQDGPSGPEIKLEATKKKGEMAEAPASPGSERVSL